MSVFLYLFVALLLYLAWLPTIRMGLKRVSCTRSFNKNAYFEGEEGQMIETIRNDSPFIIPWLRLESRISPHMRLGSQENLDVSGNMYYRSVFAPMPHQQIRRTHKMKVLRRGFYDMGTASLTAGDLLDVKRLHKACDLGISITVYPRLLEEDQIPSVMSQRLGDISNRRTLLQDPFLVRGIRPYMPGDPVRDIHWPATARMQEAQLRVRDYTTNARLLLVLNGQVEEMQWGDRLPEGKEDVFEDAIRLAASLCVQSVERYGLSAGFASNMSVIGSSGGTMILPMENGGQSEELLSTFAKLDTSCYSVRFDTFLESLMGYSGMDIMIMSLYDSAAIRNAMQRLEEAGNTVSFHQLEGGNL